MKKIVKFFLLLIFIFAISCFGHSVEANSIKSISMDIYVDKNGNRLSDEEIAKQMDKSKK